MTKNCYQLGMCRKNNLQKGHGANDLLIIVLKIGARALLFTTTGLLQPSQRVYFLHTLIEIGYRALGAVAAS
jgi:hypothetical protein